MPNRIAFHEHAFYVLFMIYITAVYAFFKLKKKKNYFDFDTIFLVILTIMHFSAPFYANTDALSRLFYVGDITSVYFTKGTLVAITGIVAYMLGSINYDIKNRFVVQVNDLFKYRNVSIGMVGITTLFVMYLFVLSGGMDFFRSQYMDGIGGGNANGLIFQTMILMCVLSNVYCALLFLKCRKLDISQKVVLSLIALFSVTLAITGNRTFPSYIILPYLLFYTAKRKAIGLSKTLLGLLSGFVLMYIIQITRSGGSAFSTDFLSLAKDLVIPANCFYGSLEYVDKFGLNLGKTMIVPILGLIPGSTALFGSRFGSAEVLTRYLFGAEEVTSGLGTTIIADIYISFGVVGVAFFMYWLGALVNKKWKYQLTDMLVKAGFYASCVFICRSQYFLPIRFIIWGLIFTYIFNVVGKNILKKKVKQ